MVSSDEENETTKTFEDIVVVEEFEHLAEEFAFHVQGILSMEHEILPGRC